MWEAVVSRLHALANLGGGNKNDIQYEQPPRAWPKKVKEEMSGRLPITLRVDVQNDRLCLSFNDQQNSQAEH